jgi:hypothetical protein
LNEGIIELKDGRAKTGKPQAIPIHTPELMQLIDELQQEKKRVHNTAGLVSPSTDSRLINFSLSMLSAMPAVSLASQASRFTI